MRMLLKNALIMAASACLILFWLSKLTLSASAGDPPPADLLPVHSNLSFHEASDQPSNSWSVKLTSDQEERAQKLYQQSVVITAHDHCFHPLDFKRLDGSGVTVRTLKLTTDGIFWWDGRRYQIQSEVNGWKERGLKALELIEKQADESSGNIVIVKTVADIYRAKAEGKLGVTLSFEGGRPLEGVLENLELYYSRGLRDLQLFWAVPNALKTGDGLLSAFGESVIREMNRLGIVIDLSHMSASAFEQAMAATTDPVIVSHCATSLSFKEIAGGTDFLDLPTIQRIAANEGVICLHFYTGYIRPRHGPNSTVEDLVDHIEFVRDAVGIEFVGLGSDYFPETGARYVEGVEGMQGMINIVREMVRRGFSDVEIEKVLGLNLIRVYERVWSD